MEKKEKWITFTMRFTKEERIKVMTMAAKEGLCVSHYIKNLLKEKGL